jgi:hypothetical protein
MSSKTEEEAIETKCLNFPLWMLQSNLKLGDEMLIVIVLSA